MHPEEQYALRALKRGRGLPPEGERAGRAGDGYPAGLPGRKYVTATLAERLALDLEDRSARRPTSFSPTGSTKVLCLLASGKGVKDIARELSLSSRRWPRTVAHAHQARADEPRGARPLRAVAQAGESAALFKGWWPAGTVAPIHRCRAPRGTTVADSPHLIHYVLAWRRRARAQRSL